MPLSEEEQAQLDALQKKAEEKEEPKASEARSLVTNITIDLDNDAQVKRAVKSGLLPASYLEDDEGKGDGEGEGEGDGEGTGEPPKRRARM